MDFIHGDSVFLGNCTDLSESGLRGTFIEPVAAGAAGLLTLYVEEQGFEIQAKVESVHGNEARLRFSIASDEERIALLGLVKIFTARSRR
jgi:hypothetical protein